MERLTGQQKKKLKSLAHNLKPVVHIGKNGLSEGLVASLDRSLSDHELIKVKFISFKDEKKGLVDRLVEETGSELVSVIGNIAILFRRNKKPEKQRIVL
jgi:RNA-binding protein